MALTDDILKIAFNQVDRQGLQVHVKTDISPSIKVYDIDSPNSESGGDSLLKYGIKVTDRNGNELANYGGTPKINYVKLAIVYGLLGAGLFVAVKGLKGVYVQFK